MEEKKERKSNKESKLEKAHHLVSFHAAVLGSLKKNREEKVEKGENKESFSEPVDCRC